MEECGELELAEQNSERSNEKAKAVQFVRSSFTGGAFANFFMALAARLATILSLGIAYPFMVCWRERWVASHTYINGKRLKFDGNGAELIGKYIIWWLLSIVTLGSGCIAARRLENKAYAFYRRKRNRKCNRKRKRTRIEVYGQLLGVSRYKIACEFGDCNNAFVRRILGALFQTAVYYREQGNRRKRV